jgi:hypothetical protein
MPSSSITLNGSTGIVNASWTTATRPASPVAGQTGYNTDIGANETYTGSTWSISDLPAAGTSGNVLTSNGTTWTSAAAPSVAGNSTTTTSASNLTLTSSSNRVQYVSLTSSSNNNVILPDATTLSKGGPVFVIVNSGYNLINIKNSSTGIVIYTLGVGQSVLLFLTDNSTADGIWATQNGDIIYGFGPVTTIATDAGFTNFEYGGNAYGPINIVTLSSTSALLVYSNASSVLANLYGVVVTISGTTITAGSPTLIYTGTTLGLDLAKLVALSSTTAMVFISRGNTTATCICYGLTISGTTLSVSTASSTFGIGWFDSAVAMNSTQVLGTYATGSTSTWVCAVFQHNGASAPTIGTASASWASSGGRTSQGSIGYLTATTAFWAQLTSGGVISGRVITISGTSAPTLGTAVSNGIANVSQLTYFGYSPTVYALSATEVFVFGSNGSMRWTVSGTTVTFGSYIPFSVIDFPGIKSATPLFFLGGSINGSIGFFPTNNTNYIGIMKFVSGQPAPALAQILPVKSPLNCGGSCTLDSTTGLYLTTNGPSSTLTLQVIKLIGP